MATVEVPETRYARNGLVSLAYQVVGDGPIDVLYMNPGVSHLDLYWQYPPAVHVFERFAGFSRLVIYDKRGYGMSDRTAEPPTVDEEAADALAVLDATGIEHASVFGGGASGAAALALAAAHPDRVDRVVAYSAVARALQAADYPHGITKEEADAMVEMVVADWGGTLNVELLAPSRVDDAAFVDWFRSMQRSGASPAGAAVGLRQSLDLDIRSVLPEVTAPVLVLNRSDALMGGSEPSRYLAEHLPDARHVELPGEDFALFAGDSDALLDEVEEFFSGRRPTPTPTRALATVMFTDIVDSTRRAADLGDTAWRDVLTRHDDRTRHHIERHGGRVVKSTGDGALATFDDPGRAIEAAQDLAADLHESGVELRVGIHTGQVEILGDDVAGLGVHLAARINGLAQPGDVLVSRTVRDLLLGSDVTFADRGTHDLKGVPDTWEILAVVDDTPA
jgi:class 3 adenylate cyclase